MYLLFCSFLFLLFSVLIRGTTLDDADSTPPADRTIQGNEEEWLNEFLDGSGDLTEFLASSDPGSSSDTIFHNSEIENLICDQDFLTEVPDPGDPAGYEMAISDLPNIADFEETIDALLSGTQPIDGFSAAEPQFLPWVVPGYGVPLPGYNDPYSFIDCDGAVPTTGFPNGRNPSEYKNLRSLCSFIGHFIHQMSANMGCACKNPKTSDPSVQCFLALADPIFTQSDLLNYCIGNCKCRSYPEGPPNFIGRVSIDLKKHLEQICKFGGPKLSGGKPESSSSSPAKKKPRPNPPDYYGRVRSHRYEERFCNVGCSRADFKCGTRSSGCACRLSSVGAGLWQPMGCMPRILADIATFPSSLGGKRRKRNGMGPPVCACNGTYVSQGCCQSMDGLIWEHPDLGLGQVSLAAYDS